MNLIPNAPCLSAVHSALSHSSRVLEKRHATRSTVLKMLKLINGSGASERGKVLKYEWHGGHCWHD